MSSSKNSKKYKIERMKDKSDNNIIHKDKIDNVNFRTLISASSGLGKTNILGNMILKDQFYNKNFYGDDIYIWCDEKSLKNCEKMKTIISHKEIPEENLFTEENFEETLKTVYDMCCDEFEERTKAKKTCI